jgi:hypothetical protein
MDPNKMMALDLVESSSCRAFDGGLVQDAVLEEDIAKVRAYLEQSVTKGFSKTSAQKENTVASAIGQLDKSTLACHWYKHLFSSSSKNVLDSPRKKQKRNLVATALTFENCNWTNDRPDLAFRSLLLLPAWSALPWRAVEVVFHGLQHGNLPFQFLPAASADAEEHFLHFTAVSLLAEVQNYLSGVTILCGAIRTHDRDEDPFAGHDVPYDSKIRLDRTHLVQQETQHPGTMSKVQAFWREEATNLTLLVSETIFGDADAGSAFSPRTSNTEHVIQRILLEMMPPLLSFAYELDATNDSSNNNEHKKNPADNSSLCRQLCNIIFDRTDEISSTLTWKQIAMMLGLARECSSFLCRQLLDGMRVCILKRITKEIELCCSSTMMPHKTVALQDFTRLFEECVLLLEETTVKETIVETNSMWNELIFSIFHLVHISTSRCNDESTRHIELLCIAKRAAGHHSIHLFDFLRDGVTDAHFNVRSVVKQDNKSGVQLNLDNNNSSAGATASTHTHDASTRNLSSQKLAESRSVAAANFALLLWKRQTKYCSIGGMYSDPPERVTIKQTFDVLLALVNARGSLNVNVHSNKPPSPIEHATFTNESAQYGNACGMPRGESSFSSASTIIFDLSERITYSGCGASQCKKDQDDYYTVDIFKESTLCHELFQASLAFVHGAIDVDGGHSTTKAMHRASLSPQETVLISIWKDAAIEMIKNETPKAMSVAGGNHRCTVAAAVLLCLFVDVPALRDTIIAEIRESLDQQYYLGAFNNESRPMGVMWCSIASLIVKSTPDIVISGNICMPLSSFISNRWSDMPRADKLALLRGLAPLPETHTVFLEEATKWLAGECSVRPSKRAPCFFSTKETLMVLSELAFATDETRIPAKDSCSLKNSDVDKPPPTAFEKCIGIIQLNQVQLTTSQRSWLISYVHHILQQRAVKKRKRQRLLRSIFLRFLRYFATTDNHEQRPLSERKMHFLPSLSSVSPDTAEMADDIAGIFQVALSLCQNATASQCHQDPSPTMRDYVIDKLLGHGDKCAETIQSWQTTTLGEEIETESEAPECRLMCVIINSFLKHLPMGVTAATTPDNPPPIKVVSGGPLKDARLLLWSYFPDEKEDVNAAIAQLPADPAPHSAAHTQLVRTLARTLKYFLFFGVGTGETNIAFERHKDCLMASTIFMCCSEHHLGSSGSSRSNRCECKSPISSSLQKNGSAEDAAVAFFALVRHSKLNLKTLMHEKMRAILNEALCSCRCLTASDARKAAVTLDVVRDVASLVRSIATSTQFTQAQCESQNHNHCLSLMYEAHMSLLETFRIGVLLHKDRLESRGERTRTDGDEEDALHLTHAGINASVALRTILDCIGILVDVMKLMLRQTMAPGGREGNHSLIKLNLECLHDLVDVAILLTSRFSFDQEKMVDIATFCRNLASQLATFLSSHCEEDLLIQLIMPLFLCKVPHLWMQCTADASDYSGNMKIPLSGAEQCLYQLKAMCDGSQEQDWDELDTQDSSSYLFEQSPVTFQMRFATRAMWSATFAVCLSGLGQMWDRTGRLCLSSESMKIQRHFRANEELFIFAAKLTQSLDAVLAFLGELLGFASVSALKAKAQERKRNLLLAESLQHEAKVQLCYCLSAVMIAITTALQCVIVVASGSATGSGDSQRRAEVTSIAFLAGLIRKRNGKYSSMLRRAHRWVLRELDSEETLKEDDGAKVFVHDNHAVDLNALLVAIEGTFAKLQRLLVTLLKSEVVRDLDEEYGQIVEKLDLEGSDGQMGLSTNLHLFLFETFSKLHHPTPAILRMRGLQATMENMCVTSPQLDQHETLRAVAVLTVGRQGKRLRSKISKTDCKVPANRNATVKEWLRTDNRIDGETSNKGDSFADLEDFLVPG